MTHSTQKFKRKILVVIALCLPFQYIGVEWKDIIVSPVDIVVISCFGFYLIELPFLRKKSKKYTRALLILFYLWSSAFFFSVIANIHNSYIPGFIRVFSILFLFYYISDVLLSKHTLAIIEKILYFWGTLFFIHGTWQQLTENGYYVLFSIHGLNVTRIGSILVNPNLLGFFLITLLPLILIRIFYEKKTSLVIMFSTLSFLLLVTFSRSSWIIFLFDILIIWFILGNLRRHIHLAAGIILSTLFLSILYYRFSDYLIFMERLLYIADDPSTYNRIIIYKEVLRFIPQIVTLGLGYQSFQKYSADYPAHPLMKGSIGSAQNSFLEIAFEEGLLVMLLLLLFNIVLLKRLWTLVRIRELISYPYSRWCLSLFVILMNYFIYSFSFSGMYRNVYYWFFCALALSMLENHRRYLTPVAHNKGLLKV